jgi:hypothetical protein
MGHCYALEYSYLIVSINFLEQKDDEVEEYRQRFAGSQAERARREAEAVLLAKAQAVAISGKPETLNFKVFNNYFQWGTTLLTCGNRRRERREVQRRIDQFRKQN